MPDLPNRSPTVHCARSCTLRQVPRSLPGRQGNALYGEDVTAFDGCGNRILERCEYPPRSPRLRERRSFGISACFNIGSSDAVPLTAVVFRRLCTRQGPSCLDIAAGGNVPQ